MGATVDRSLTAGRLRPILERHPESFRVLDALPGTWRASANDPEGGSEMQYTWVVVLGLPQPADREDEPLPSFRTALRMRESVRWLARGLDGRSRVDSTRWDVIARAERATREIVLTLPG